MPALVVFLYFCIKIILLPGLISNKLPAVHKKSLTPFFLKTLGMDTMSRNTMITAVSAAALSGEGPGTFSMTRVSLKDLPDGYLPFIKNKGIQGDVSIDASIAREFDDRSRKIRLLAEITLQNLYIDSKDITINLKDHTLTVTSDSVYDLDGDIVEIGFMEVKLDQFSPWTLKGTVHNVFSGKPGLDLMAEGSGIPFQEIKNALSGETVAWLKDFDVQGAINANVSIKGDAGSPRINGVLTAKGGSFQRNTAKLASFEVSIPMVYYKENFTVRDAFISVQDFSILTTINNKHVHSRFNNVGISIPYFTYRDSDFKSEPVRIAIDEGLLTGNGNKEYYRDKNLLLEGAGEGNIKKGLMKLTDLLFTSDTVNETRGDILLNMGKEVTIDAALEFKKLDIEMLSRKFQGLLQKKKVKVHGTGSLNTHVKIVLPEGSSPRVTGTADVSISGGGFSSFDESKIGEGIELKASGNFTFHPPDNLMTFDVTSQATGFELLAGKFYGDFTDRVLSISSAGEYSTDDGTVRVLESDFALTGIGNVFISGNIWDLKKSPSFDLDINLTNMSNGAAYNLFIRDTFQEEVPLLSRIEFDGTSGVNVTVKGMADRFSARGQLQIADMNITDTGADRHVKNIHMSLPFDITYPQSEEKKGTAAFGYLRVKDLSWASLNMRDIEVFPALWGNALLFREDIRLQLYRGDVILKDIAYNDIFRPGRNLRLAIDIQDIDLGEASTAFELPVFEGELSGTIPNVTLRGNSLATDGEIVLNLFDGTMSVSNLSIDNVFTSTASFKSSIALSNIDLGKLTRTFNFGQISGVIQGSVQDLVIVKRQAEHFRAKLETVKKRGLSQKINVAALKKITILGTGSSASILDKGIYQFFKEYRYEKLGFTCYLKNDNLVLLGIESRGTTGYLVKGGFFPPKVDVINYTQNISFQEMVKRLKRINFAGQ